MNKTPADLLGIPQAQVTPVQATPVQESDTPVQVSNVIQDVKETSAIPTITVIKELPSRGLSYPEGSEISYRPYSFGEAKKLSQSKFSYKEYVDFVLSGVFVTGIVSKYDLTYQDFLFIALLRRISTVQTSTISVSFPCQHCNTSNSYNVEVSDLEFQDSELPKLPIKCTILGKELKFSYMTIRDFLDLQKQDKLKDPLYVMAKEVRNLPVKEAYELLSSDRLSFEEGSVLDVIDRQLFHGLKPKNFVCQNSECGETSSIQMELNQIIIAPFREDGDDIGTRITYGD